MVSDMHCECLGAGANHGGDDESDMMMMTMMMMTIMMMTMMVMTKMMMTNMMMTKMMIDDDLA